MTTSKNAQILSNIKKMQVTSNNQNVINDIHASAEKQVRKTALAAQYAGDTWLTDLPDHDEHGVFLLLAIPDSKKRQVISNAHIIHIGGDVLIQNSSHAFLYETRLVGWMRENDAQNLLKCY